jgi:hypothetical protein
MTMMAMTSRAAKLMATPTPGSVTPTLLSLPPTLLTRRFLFPGYRATAMFPSMRNLGMEHVHEAALPLIFKWHRYLGGGGGSPGG